jgi:hypothetical protein
MKANLLLTRQVVKPGTDEIRANFGAGLLAAPSTVHASPKIGIYSKDIHMTFKGRVLLLSPLVLALAIGCGSSVNPNAPSTVSGKITYKGTALPDGNVIYIPDAGGGACNGRIEADGKYSVIGLQAAAYTVVIDTGTDKPATPAASAPNMQPQGRKEKVDESKMTEDQKKMYEMANKGIIGKVEGDKMKYTKIPDKYKDQKTSPLKITLTKGSNSKDWDLTD